MRILPVAIVKMAATPIAKRGFARTPPLQKIGKSATAAALKLTTEYQMDCPEEMLPITERPMFAPEMEAEIM